MTPPSKVSIIAVSRRGSALAVTVGAALPGARLLLPRRFVAAHAEAYDGGVLVAVAAAFAQAEALVLIMATGIAVRAVAPLLRDKPTDPAIVVIDDAGRFAISLAGGHLGGANALAAHLAGAIGAVPVITTASEGAGVPALDLIAAQLGWRIDSGSDLTRVMAALVNGEPVALLQECGSRDWLADRGCANLRSIAGTDELGANDAGVIVVSCIGEPEPTSTLPRVLLRPPVLALGAGCSTGAAADELIDLAHHALARAGLSPACVAAVATIDRRHADPAIVALGRLFNAPIQSFTSSELDAAPGAWRRSQVVFGAVGTGGVCEPAAILAAGGGSLIVSKRKSAHCTVAVAHRGEASRHSPRLPMPEEA
ncbi:MAG TPA: cobalamin biosynthesis protein [Dehalococcoidia bacterium]|nr:cobalamin biosynthesis protein [Dehalococcoidia bacterium]